MADSTNPQLIAWSNSRSRTIADRLTQANAVLLAYKTDWSSQGVSPLAVTAGANNIADGYTTDGRAPVTGNSLVNLKAALDQLDTAFNTTLVSGVGLTVAAILNGIQVNGSVK